MHLVFWLGCVEGTACLIRLYSILGASVIRRGRKEAARYIIAVVDVGEYQMAARARHSMAWNFFFFRGGI
jgi:hypothetical protein